jgi:hypothetical protein
MAELSALAHFRLDAACVVTGSNILTMVSGFVFFNLRFRD